MLTTRASLTRCAKRAAHSGLSIVELLVGIAVGMFVLAGAAMVATNQLVDNKRMLLETQVQQDMRAAMDIIVRDIRRSGYTSKAALLIQPVEAKLAPLPDYKPAGVMDASKPLLYSYAKNDGLAAASEDNKRGFRLNAKRIEALLGNGGYQALTDPNVVEITDFKAGAADVTATKTWLPVCATPPCPSTNCPDGQYITTRNIDLEMTGKAVHDSSVQRTIRATVRVRNDEVCR
jgi:type IV pilus assembly protein PilW